MCMRSTGDGGGYSVGVEGERDLWSSISAI